MSQHTKCLNLACVVGLRSQRNWIEFTDCKQLADLLHTSDGKNTSDIELHQLHYLVKLLKTSVHSITGCGGGEGFLTW